MLQATGRVAGKDFDPARSDLDSLVEDEDLPDGEHADAYFGLLEGLQELFGCPVDLEQALFFYGGRIRVISERLSRNSDTQ